MRQRKREESCRLYDDTKVVLRRRGIRGKGERRGEKREKRKKGGKIRDNKDNKDN